MLVSWQVFAKPVALINKVVGNVFGISGEDTRYLRPGDHVTDFSEIVTEEGATVTFSDYYDHKFHMAGSGHVKLIGNVVEIVAGYLWIQTFTPSVDRFFVQTANSIITYSDGEAVVSYDKYHGKTQIYSMAGRFEFAHLLQRDYREIVSRGEFSFISNDFESGAPRKATELGRVSYDKMRSLFLGINPVEKKNPLLLTTHERKIKKRTPASLTLSTARKVADEDSWKSGKIIYLRDDTEKKRKIKDKILSDFYKERISTWAASSKKKRFAPAYKKHSGVKVRIFGSKKRKPAGVMKKLPIAPLVPSKKRSRTPASVKIKVNNGAFESSLVDEYKKQMRHSKEVNSLIQSLKNYEQDYKTDY